MPNRGPVELSCAEFRALLSELPPSRPLSEAEDQEDRMKIQMHAKIRGVIEEQLKALGDDADGRGTMTVSTDEVDEILDCLPPPPSLAAVRTRLSDARVAMLS